VSEAPVILFDGVCNLCNATVKIVLQNEARPLFQFASLQSEAGRALVAKHHITADSIVLVDGDRVFVRSAAALRIARHLRFPWKLFAAFWIVPWPLRDLVYVAIARSRYAVFGKSDACMVPTADMRARFLEDRVPA
jgi:predicted DCC family thiol-disulfide oxidoreductase YuxK